MSRVALVTGASRGIGRGIALALAEAGHDVVVNYVNNAGAAAAVVEQAQRSGVRATAIQADVSLAADRERLVSGPYFLTQLVARRMVGQGGPPGKVVVVSSISAYAASVNRGDYCLAKAGLAMMTALYAARLAEYGITVHEIRPGVIATDMTGALRERCDKLIADGLTPIRRWGQPEDVARAVVAVATDLLPFSTGQVIDVDGGFHLRTL